MNKSYLKLAAAGIFILVAAGFAIYYSNLSKNGKTINLSDSIQPSATIEPTPAVTSTPEINPKTLTIAAAGDIACNTPKTTATCFHKETSDVVEKINPDKVITLGDQQYPNGSISDFKKYYAPTWGRFKDKTWPVPGNHEYETLRAKFYFDYMGDQYNYYSNTINNWHFIGLNGNCGSQGVRCDTDSDQYRWLVNDLKENTKPCILAYWHAPLFSSGKHGGFKAVKPFWDLLYKNNVSIVLNGHDHIYERFAKQNPDGKRTIDGIQQFTVGTGGYSLYSFENTEKNSEFKQNKDYGVLKLILKDKDYSWEFINTDNKVLDKGSNTCNEPAKS